MRARDFIRTGLSAALLLGLAACNGGGGNSAASGGSGSSPATPAAATLSAGCSWPAVSDPDLLNVAFPDESASYWVTELPYVPGTRIRIEGEFPDARYFSFNLYDSLLQPTDALTDFRIEPEPGSANPFQAPASAGGHYIAYILPQTVPEQRTANTLYSGSMALPGGQQLPNPRISVIYRIYLGAGDRQGGVALPKLTLETADGATPLLGLSSCQPLPPDLGLSIINQSLRDGSFPHALAVLPYPLAASKPEFLRFYSLPETLRLMLGNAVGQELPLTQLTSGSSGGFLSNRDNAYVAAQFTREKGELYVVRGKAPGFGIRNAQLRYWSLCTNEFISQRFVACAPDYSVPLDGDGYFTVVVSDPDLRPANAIAENGVLWLPWGAAYYDSVLIYRHMLPSAGFDEAIQNVPFGTPAEQVMGEYYPQTTYCTRDIIEAAGKNPAQIYSACRQAQSHTGPQT